MGRSSIRHMHNIAMHIVNSPLPVEKFFTNESRDENRIGRKNFKLVWFLTYMFSSSSSYWMFRNFQKDSQNFIWIPRGSLMFVNIPTDSYRSLKILPIPGEFWPSPLGLDEIFKVKIMNHMNSSAKSNFKLVCIIWKSSCHKKRKTRQ